jgi:hypothetical protein
MVTPRTIPSLRRWVRRARARVGRSDERGATMFIVLMVLMILSAIGTFALSTARYEVRTSGYRRQRAQAQLAANYGGFAAQMSMDPSKAAWFVQQLTASGEPCQMNLGAGPCYHIYATDVERIAGLSASSEKVFVVPGTTSGQAEGSFGLDALNGGFRVELTEPADLMRPVAGWSAGGDQSTVKFVDLTVTSMGVVFPDGIDGASPNGIVDANERAGASYANVRGHVVLGPLTQ